MNKLSLRSLCYTYVLFACLTAAILSSLPYRLFAAVLFLVMLAVIFRPLPPKFNVVIIVATIFVVPLVFEPLGHYLTREESLPSVVLLFMVVVADFPVIYLLDDNLRHNAQDMVLVRNINDKKRHLTATGRRLFGSAVVIFLISFIGRNPILLFTAITLFLYLLVTLIRILQAVPRLPFDIPTVRKRIVAGTTADLPLYVTNQASLMVHTAFSSVEPWVKITPQELTLERTKTQLKLTLTPPLAGPSHLHLQASVIDPWGLSQVNQVIEPIELHVIPRAKYAEWLAREFLEKTGTGAAVAETASEVTLILRRGIEYFDSRTYQPGDSLRHVDWKHTLKLNQLIIKQYIEVSGQVAAIVVNLSVANAEAADKLAFNLITTALTLAQESIPSALAAYNHQQVILTTPVMAPREVLQQALSLVKNITSVEFAHRYLQPLDISKLRRNIAQLRQVLSPPAQRLLAVLDFEYRAICEEARNHPATLALTAVARQTQLPAMIALVSELNHDAEAVAITAGKLTARGITTIHIGANH